MISKELKRQGEINFIFTMHISELNESINGKKEV